MPRLISRFCSNTAGATSIEYAMIAGMISLTIIAGLTAIRGELSTIFTNVSAGFE